MKPINDLSREDYLELQDKIADQAAGCAVLEEAAQRYMSVLYETFHDSIVLTRFFATIPYGKIPEKNKAFVLKLAQSVGLAERISDETLILSLLGSRGGESAWNDRRQSQGHVGIPLVSSDFIDKIPMMSRLLKQLGAGIDWIDAYDTQLVAKTFENLSGVFYVRDAEVEVDNQGRKIIAAQEFVKDKGVKTVYGIGGCYMGYSLFFATVVFLRQCLDKEKVERFMIQANKFKAVTLELVDEGKIFA